MPLRGYLTHRAALMAVNALIRSRLDYCNSLFWSLSALDLQKVQCVKKAFARIATNTTKYLYISPVRKTLHWLPFEHHSIFNTVSLVYKFLHIGYLKYFVPFLKPRHSVNNTHKTKLMVCCFRSHTLPLQYLSLSILASALLMMLQRFGMICLVMYVQPLLFTCSETSSKPISKQKPIQLNFCFSQSPWH